MLKVRAKPDTVSNKRVSKISRFSPKKSNHLPLNCKPAIQTRPSTRKSPNKAPLPIAYLPRIKLEKKARGGVSATISRKKRIMSILSSGLAFNIFLSLINQCLVRDLPPENVICFEKWMMKQLPTVKRPAIRKATLGMVKELTLLSEKRVVREMATAKPAISIMVILDTVSLK